MENVTNRLEGDVGKALGAARAVMPEPVKQSLAAIKKNVPAVIAGVLVARRPSAFGS